MTFLTTRKRLRFRADRLELSTAPMQFAATGGDFRNSVGSLVTSVRGPLLVDKTHGSFSLSKLVPQQRFQVNERLQGWRRLLNQLQLLPLLPYMPLNHRGRSFPKSYALNPKPYLTLHPTPTRVNSRLRVLADAWTASYFKASFIPSSNQLRTRKQQHVLF